MLKVHDNCLRLSSKIASLKVINDAQTAFPRCHLPFSYVSRFLALKAFLSISLILRGRKTKSLEFSDNQYQNTCLECDKH